MAGNSFANANPEKQVEDMPSTLTAAGAHPGESEIGNGSDMHQKAVKSAKNKTKLVNKPAGENGTTTGENIKDPTDYSPKVLF